MVAREPVVTVALDPDWASGALVDDVRRGLGSQPRTLPPKWLYDDVGSELFDEITRLPEYYPTERERAILRDHADDIVQACDASTLVELGSGTSDKTRLLLDAFTAGGQLTRFVPVDVSDATLRHAAAELSKRYPTLAVEALVGDFTLHLGHLPRGDRVWSPSSAAPSATSTSRSAPPSSGPLPTVSSPATGCCSAPISSRAPTGSSPPTTTVAA